MRAQQAWKPELIPAEQRRDAQPPGLPPAVRRVGIAAVIATGSCEATCLGTAWLLPAVCSETREEREKLRGEFLSKKETVVDDL